MTALRLDHLAVSAGSLAEGAVMVEDALGVALAGGGAHPHMGTHNRLLGLGDLYLEVIAIDPAAPRPAWPRWFDLDAFSGAPRLTNWVARCDDLDAAVMESPDGVGAPIALTRAEYRWHMAVPPDGRLPFDGAFPALIRWEGAAHPARALPDAGIRLRLLRLEHPDADALRDALRDRLDDDRVEIASGPAKAMRAVFSTPHGDRVLE